MRIQEQPGWYLLDASGTQLGRYPKNTAGLRKACKDREFFTRNEVAGTRFPLCVADERGHEVAPDDYTL